MRSSRRLQRMLDTGVIRRIGAVPNHYAIGYTANGMSVWDVDDARIDELGARVGALEFVTHCYRRPRRLPDWPYNLFAMVHSQRSRGGRRPAWRRSPRCWAMPAVPTTSSTARRS
jgi:DNA-binding Lrp family transcriptional regulator